MVTRTSRTPGRPFPPIAEVGHCIAGPDRGRWHLPLLAAHVPGTVTLHLRSFCSSRQAESSRGNVVMLRPDIGVCLGSGFFSDLSVDAAAFAYVFIAG